MDSAEQPLWGLTAAEMQLMQRLQRAIPEARPDELALLLQLEIRPREPERKQDQNKPFLIAERGITLPASEAAGDYPPRKKDVRFLHLHGRVTKKLRKEKKNPPDWYAETEVCDGEIQSRMGKEIPAEPLTSWEEIWPALHAFFSDYKKTNRLDIRTIIDKATKRQPLTKIPWKEKLHWPQEIVLLVDFSRHLCPYFLDYQQLAYRLILWFKHRLQLVVCTDSERQIFLYDGRHYHGFPVKGENLRILYLGDLGLLDQQRISPACWFFLGRDLRQCNARIEALLTVHPMDWDRRLSRYFNLHYWDAGGLAAHHLMHITGSERGINSRLQTEELLCCLSQAFELTPGLVRKARKRLGFNVSAEGLIFQHSALTGNALSYQWRSKEIQKAYSDHFKELPYDHAEIGSLIMSFESRLPCELQIEQRQKAGRKLLLRQKNFIRRLIKSEREGCLSPENQAMLFGWIGRMAERSTDEKWGEETSNLYELYRREMRPEDIPLGVDRTRLPAWLAEPGKQRQVRVVQWRDRLLFKTEKNPEEKGMEIARFQTTEQADISLFSSGGMDQKQTLPLDGEIILSDKVREIRINTLEEQHLIRPFSCPDWATAIGRDRHGIFTEIHVRGVSFVLRWIPPGQFKMGSPGNEPEMFNDEGPQHQVSFTQGFWLAETACSQELWLAVKGSNPSRFTENPQNPVEQVGWEEACRFIAQLNMLLPGLEARLPSEAEWEYACRAGTTTPFWFGEELSTDEANYDGNYPYNQGKKGAFREKTLPVRWFHPNPWGLYQMHGNVWEWCRDRWHTNYQGAPTDGSAWEEGDSEYHVCRGGSWIGDGGYLRSACRSYWHIGDGPNGFRLARGPESTGQEEAGGGR